MLKILQIDQDTIQPDDDLQQMTDTLPFYHAFAFSVKNLE